MAQTQRFRDMRAIRTVLTQLDRASYPEIALRAGEGLLEVLRDMVEAGEVKVHRTAVSVNGSRTTYSLA